MATTKFFTTKTSKSFQRIMAVLIVALMLSLLLSFPSVAGIAAGVVESDPVKRKSLANKIQNTAMAFVWVGSAIVTTMIASVFIPALSPFLPLIGLAIVGIGVYYLARNWGMVTSGSGDMMKDQVKDGISLSNTD